MAYLKITYDNVVKYGLTPIKAVRMVNALQDTAGIINWHFFAEKEDGSIFCEFRSNGPRVNDIAFKYGGGGHMLAAGASVASWDVVDNIIKDMDDNCRNLINNLKLRSFMYKKHKTSFFKIILVYYVINTKNKL